MNDKLIQINQQQPAESGTLAQVKQANVDPEIIALASAFFAGGSITKEAAVRAAYYVKNTGEMEGRDFYIGTTGNVAGKLIEGYQGIQDRVGRRYQLRYRNPTVEDRQQLGIREDDHAMICEAYVLDDMVACQNIGFPYEPVVGYCAFAKGDKPRVPTGRNLDWCLRKSARKDALRQVPGAPDEDDPNYILSAAEERGLRIGFDQEKRKYLTSSQAETLVEDAEAQAKRAARPEAEKQAEALRNAIHQHKMAYEGRMGMAERCPDCGADLPDHANTCDWFDFAPRYGDVEDILTVHEERGELTSAEIIRAMVLVEAGNITGEPTDRDRQWANASLHKLWPADEQRHAARSWLFGKASTRDMTRGELFAAKNLAGLTKVRNPDVADPNDQHAYDWIPSEQGIKAARVISAELFPPSELPPAAPAAEVAP